MSETTRIPKILEGFTMGEAISGHNGVVCYPAMRNCSDDKYIVKVISVPASEVQLEALLLSGAYATREDALLYYKDRASEILQEMRLMNQLSDQEGFVPYLDGEIKEKEDGNGYEVHLLATYQTTLEQVFAENMMTHQGIMDLAMDLCGALAACRRAGYLYIDLKPENIFYSKETGYRIGDLGFISLASLKYASLPEKYQSLYIAPEITDAGSELGTTMDVYALGLVLYQAYNGGTLPMEENRLAQPLMPPVYADYEMAEIILTACHPDLARRYPDPTALGQALVQYLQRNGSSDAPIVPAPVSTPELDAGEDFLPEEDVTETEDWESIPELAFLQELVDDDTAPTMENTNDLSDTAVSEETSEMLAQVEELLTLTPPDPVVAPEPIHVPTPEPIVAEPEPAVEEEPQEALTTEQPRPEVISPEAETAQPEPIAAEPAESQESPQEPVKESAPEPVSPAADKSAEKKAEKMTPKSRRRIVRRVVSILILLILAAFTFVGVQYYRNTYLQQIDRLTITGNADSIVVQIETQVDESLLTVTCSDAYGNTYYSPVSAGLAIFTGLSPQTRYTIRVQINGNYKLTGAVTDSFTTDTQTVVNHFTATVGPEDGSVYLSFHVSGAECDEWILSYVADGVEEKSITFAGHSATVYDLAIGLEYTFTLSASGNANIAGQTQISYVSRLVTRAQNPEITACGNGILTVQWETPEGDNVQYWTIRCYNGSGYDQTVTTINNTFTFSGLNHDTACNVEITAAGMTQSVTVSIDANPINIQSYRFHLTDDDMLAFQWNFSGADPENGWIIQWFYDGTAVQTLETVENQIILDYIPNGNYTVSLIPADGSVIFGHTITFTAPEAEPFIGYGISSENLNFMMCAIPDLEDWQWDDITQDDYTYTFSPGDAAGFVVWCNTPIEVSEEITEITFLIRDENGNLLDMSNVEALWQDMWYQSFCELTIPTMPYAMGNYRIWIYFDGMLVTFQDFIIA